MMDVCKNTGMHCRRTTVYLVYKLSVQLKTQKNIAYRKSFLNFTQPDFLFLPAVRDVL